jgi:hypothetical protein
MILINTGSYPLQNVQECIKAFLELPAIPDYITEKGLYSRFDKEKGIEFIHVLEFDDAKFTDTMDFITERMKILSRVQGFNCSCQPWSTIEQSLSRWV